MGLHKGRSCFSERFLAVACINYFQITNTFAKKVEKSEWVNRIGEITTKWFLSSIHTTHAKDYHTFSHF